MNKSIIGVLAAAALVGCSSSGSSGVQDAGPATVACNSPLFTQPPIPAGELSGIVPLGNMNPPGHTTPSDHISIPLPSADPTGATRVTKSEPLVAPGAMTITRVLKQTGTPQGSSTSNVDYAIDFTVCDGVDGNFGHATTLSQAVIDAAGAIDQDCTDYQSGTTAVHDCSSKYFALQVAAGDSLGTVGAETGDNPPVAFDVDLHDARVDAGWANPANHPGYNPVCAIDYYAGDLQATLRQQLGKVYGHPGRTVEPVCGTPNQDLVGTAQGDWFGAGDAFAPGQRTLALAHDNYGGIIPQISTDGSIDGLPIGLYEFPVQSSGSTNREFSAVTAGGGVFCFESLTNDYGDSTFGGVVLVQMPTATTLDVQADASTTTCAASSRTIGSGATHFAR